MSTETAAGHDFHIVGFQVGRETYGVPIAALHEIVRVPEITAVPDAPEFVEGVINLRGKIVSVIDLRKRLGENSYRIAAKFAPERFGEGLQRAASVAMEIPQKRFGIMDRALLLAGAKFAR